ncbi:MAG TPA: hypothetical protein VGM29_19605 [Polyangiaceae bacterium]
MSPPIAAAASEPPAPAQSAAPAAVAEPALSQDIPSECAGAGEGCVPPVAFAQALCKGKFPDLALLLFGKRMPWQRVYVKAEWIEPVNVYGGDQSEAWLHFGEEVVVLRKHVVGDKAGVRVSGPSDVDILRWDGTCATVRQEMLVTYATGQIDSPRIIWRYLDPPTTTALLQDAHVQQASEHERKICKGSSAKHPEEPCDKAMKTLTAAIMTAVRAGISLPDPEKRPQWAK